MKERGEEGKKEIGSASQQFTSGYMYDFQVRASLNHFIQVSAINFVSGQPARLIQVKAQSHQRNVAGAFKNIFHCCVPFTTV